MELTGAAVRAHRLCAHHLASPLPSGAWEAAAGACGVQNSPPGAWEWSVALRVRDITREGLHAALERDRRLVQAWSYRGVPVIFPAAERDVFLTPLAARPGEEPWIYTRGITLALEHLGIAFDELLPTVEAAARWLDGHTVRGKAALDRSIAAEAEPQLPPAVRARWRDSSMYGVNQTVGEAAVSFLLRPCSFHSLVVFGAREGSNPSFTSMRHWLGALPPERTDGERELVRKFLHCYGPATVTDFAAWLGSSPRQARRLWQSVAAELVPVQVEGRKCYLLAEDAAAITHGPDAPEDRLLLLGPHDPYLDLRDRQVILSDKTKHRAVWQTVSNPGAVLRAGRIVGVWRARAARDGLALTITLFEPLPPARREDLAIQAEALAAFRGLTLRELTVVDPA